MKRTLTILAIAAATTAATVIVAPSANADTAFIANGDYVHRSDGYASAHAWWEKVGGTGTTAKVTICLEKKSGSGWSTKVCESAVLLPGSGGSGRRVTAKYPCGTVYGPFDWRSTIHVAVTGESTVPMVAYTAEQWIACS